MVTVYGDMEAATLLWPGYTPDNRLQFIVSGLPGSSYVVQLNTNLNTANWQVAGVGFVPFTFVESNAVAPQRFYRALFLH
jgi:hypothetical protein